MTIAALRDALKPALVNALRPQEIIDAVTGTTIRKLRVYPQGSRLRYFVIEASNDLSGAWTALYTRSSGDYLPEAWSEFTFANSAGYRYYRLRETTSSWFVVFELELYETAESATNIATGKTYFSLSQSGGGPRVNAFDGNLATYYSAASNTTDNYLGVDFGV